jgi:hypothetical protein
MRRPPHLFASIAAFAVALVLIVAACTQPAATNAPAASPSAMMHESPSAMTEESPSAMMHESPSAMTEESPSAMMHESPSPTAP